ncbi:MAG: hypothetical protein DMF84_05580 [Acidobacteria bacterium]|nr:MAG: hypothetical protein DMF84_05580 [Acidobacteriota bacterium]
MPEWKAVLIARLVRLRLRPPREREIVDELSQHLDDRYQELRAAGAGHDEAMRLAIDEIDDEDLFDREMRTLRQSFAREPIAAGAPRGHLLSDLWRDLVYAARSLWKSRGFAVAAILTLALGIGANTAIFSLVNATLLQHLPVNNRDRLVYAFRGPVGGVFSYPAYAALRDGNRLLDALAAWGGISASLNADGETDLLSGAIVTGNFFDVLGVSAERGRLLSTADDLTPGAHPAAVISRRLQSSRAFLPSSRCSRATCPRDAR